MNPRTRSRVVSFSNSSLKENFSSLSRIYIRYFFYFFLLSRRSRTRSRAASLLRKGRPVDPRSADRWWTTPTCVANMYSSARGGKRACARSRGSAPADSARRFKELITLILEFFFLTRCLGKIIVPIICWVASETLNRQCSMSESLKQSRGKLRPNITFRVHCSSI